VGIDEADSDVSVASKCPVHGPLAQHLAVDAVHAIGGDGADHVGGVDVLHVHALCHVTPCVRGQGGENVGRHAKNHGHTHTHTHTQRERERERERKRERERERGGGEGGRDREGGWGSRSSTVVLNHNPRSKIILFIGGQPPKSPKSLNIII
jgi:hypothetical protein